MTEQKTLSDNLPLIAGLVALVVLGVIVWIYSTREPALEPLPEQPIPAKAEPVAPAEPVAVQESPPQVASVEEQTLEEEEVVEPLPNLDGSDAEVLSALSEISADSQWIKWLVPDELLRKSVRALENVNQGKLVNKYRPVTDLKKNFIAKKNGDQYRMGEASFERYDSYVAAVTQLDTDALVALYRRYQPLLEEAHKELGTKDGNFHTSLLGAIDQLLAAPDVEGEIALVRPSVMYKFADPALEKLPEAQKLMLRMGSENATKVKASLKRLRRALAE